MSDKSFPISAVLSVVTGRLMGDIGEVYEVLNFMTGESLFTHQLPRVSREAAPVIIARHPSLQAAVDEAEQVTPENYREWLTRWRDRYGEAMAVPLLTIAEHQRIDPLSELSEKIHPSKIIVAVSGAEKTAT